MSERTRSQRNQLDEVLDGVEAGWELPGELFAVVDLLDGQPALRRALTDPGASDSQRTDLVHRLFESRLQPATVQVVAAAAQLRWPGGRSLVDALEREGVRGHLRLAAEAGHLDDVEDELFRFGRTVAGDVALRDALADRTADLGHRQNLVADLLANRASEQTLALAQRAVAARDRTFAVTLEDYVTLAAALRNRVVATVRSALPLDEQQTERLRAALAAQVGRDVSLQMSVEPGLLGGVRVELGDEVIDGTVAAKLSGARRQFG